MKRSQWVMSRLTIAVAVCFVCFTVAHAKKPGPPGGDAAYTIVPFMPPGVETLSSRVNDLNEQGHAVGSVELADGNSPAVHLDLATGVYTTLPGGLDTTANDMNNLNQIVGKVGAFGAFWNGPTADPVPLPALPPTTDPPPGVQSLGVQSGGALGINDSGIVIGGSSEIFEVENGDGTTSLIPIMTASVWRVVVDNGGDVHVDGPLPLLPLDGHVESFAGSLNELASGSAQATGYSLSPSEAVVWTIGLNPDGTLALPGPPVSLSPSPSRGNGINNFGDVCGRSDERPFVAPAGQGAQALQVPRNTQDGSAHEINDLGEIVGHLDIQKVRGGQINPPKWHAYLWRGGQAIDLKKQIAANSGWDKLKWANTINNAGVIGGRGSFDVPLRGFLLIPNQP